MCTSAAATGQPVQWFLRKVDVKQSTESINFLEMERGIHVPRRRPGLTALSSILVATDFSPRAERALLRAAQLAMEHQATLEILHVHERWCGHKLVKHCVSDLALELRPRLAKYAVQPERVSISQASGKPASEIVRHARKGASNLIVVGDHERKLLADAFGRTTAEDILAYGDRPLLVVKRSGRSRYRRVLVPVDFSENSRSVLRAALRLAPEAEFNVLHCYEGIERQLLRTDVPPSEIMRYRREFARKARQEMKAFLDTVGHGRKGLIGGIWFGRAPHVITMVAKRMRADLVAVGTEGRTGLPRILFGSVAKHVMRQVDSDVLVMRSGGRAL